MFNSHLEMQFKAYNAAASYYAENFQKLIDIERFVMNKITDFIDSHLSEITRDYDEASRLYPFWKNYPPLDRGRSPIGDQYPWIEVGEQVFGNKLSRYFAANFQVKDTGLPSGADDRCIISDESIRQILGLTDSVWVFIDIKSAGPRDNAPHAVMSPNQVSGSGEWAHVNDGIRNAPIKAVGATASHDFLCSLSPIYVLSDGTVAPLLTFVIKPLYDMLGQQSGNTVGQPLKQITVASIPNGLLLTRRPNYLQQHPGLFFPGKDDKGKNPLKRRARVSFGHLANIADWRVKEITLHAQD